jgi:hypothetical protein
MRQLYYSLIAVIIWLSLLFNLEGLVTSFSLPPFLYVFIPVCAVTVITVLGLRKLSAQWLLVIGLFAYALLEYQFGGTQTLAGLPTVIIGLSAVVVTILLSSLLGRRLAALRVLLTNLVVGQQDKAQESFGDAQGLLYREVRRARRNHQAQSSLACRVSDFATQSACQCAA